MPWWSVRGKEKPPELDLIPAQRVRSSRLSESNRRPIQQWQASDMTVPEPFSVVVLKKRIREALADSNFLNWDQFEEVAMGYGVDAQLRGEAGRGITYRMMRDDGTGRDEWLEEGSAGDRTRASRLGTEFMMEAVERSIQRNAMLRAQRYTQVPAVASQRRAEPSRVAVVLRGILDDPSDEFGASMDAPDGGGAHRGNDEGEGGLERPAITPRREADSPVSEPLDIAPDCSEVPAPNEYEHRRRQLFQRLAAKGLTDEPDSGGREFG